MVGSHITWRHDSVLVSIFRPMCGAVLRLIKKEHQQVKLGVFEQEVKKIVQFKSIKCSISSNESASKEGQSGRGCCCTALNGCAKC